MSVGLVGNSLDGGQGGDFPEGTLIEGCLGREVGVFGALQRRRMEGCASPRSMSLPLLPLLLPLQ